MPEGHLALRQAMDGAWDGPAGALAHNHLNCSKH